MVVSESGAVIIPKVPTNADIVFIYHSGMLLRHYSNLKHEGAICVGKL